MTMKWYNRNGILQDAKQFEAWLISIDSLFKAGIFESMLWTGNAIQLVDYHLRRFQNAAAIMQLELPVKTELEWLEQQVRELIEVNGLLGAVKVRWCIFPEQIGSTKAQYSISLTEIAAEALQWNERGWKMHLYQVQVVQSTESYNLKLIDRTLYDAAFKAAQANNCHDAILVNERQQLIESAIANLFIWKQGQLITPPLRDGQIAGVMRQFILDHFEVLEQPITVNDLQDAEELFISNAIRTIKWVQLVGNQTFSNQLTAQLNKQVRGLLNAPQS